MDKEKCPYKIGQKIDNNSYTILSIQEGKGFWDLHVSHIETGKKQVLTNLKPSVKKKILGHVDTIIHSLNNPSSNG